MAEERRLVLILGGARSGKSRHAEALATEAAAPVYIATAEALDDEMSRRIADHRARRDQRWTTVEAPRDLPAALDRHAVAGATVLVDCVTLWLSNLLLADADLEAAGGELIATLSKARGTVILVSNEVGLGIVPENALARTFRDAAGTLNQRLAAAADEVVFVAAGLPLVMKGPRS